MAVSRRSFLGSVAAGVGIVSSVLEAESAAPRQNVRIVAGKQVLTAGDFQYAGLFTLPAGTGGTRFGFSNGALTARKVNGELRFFMTGAIPNGDPIYEVTYPGFGPKGAAPRAELVKNWGDRKSVV